jgi:hypothetical protein
VGRERYVGRFAGRADVESRDRSAMVISSSRTRLSAVVRGLFSTAQAVDISGCW